MTSAAILASQLRRDGRRGDTVLAHISPQEVAMLLRAGGAGTRNPKDRLPEFWNAGGNSDTGGGSGPDGGTPGSDQGMGSRGGSLGDGPGAMSGPGTSMGDFQGVSMPSQYGGTAYANTTDPFANAPTVPYNAAPPTVAYTPSAKERDMAIRTVAAEDPDNPAAVAAVMNNRFQDANTGAGFSQYGTTLGSQISAPAQFSGYGDHNYRDLQAGSPEYNNIGAAVDGVLSGTIADPTYGATSYYGVASQGPVLARAGGYTAHDARGNFVGVDANGNSVQPSWAVGQPQQQIGGQNYLGGFPQSAALSSTLTPNSAGSFSVDDALRALDTSPYSKPAASSPDSNRLSFSADPAQAQYRGTPDGSQYGYGDYAAAAAAPASPPAAPASLSSFDLGFANPAAMAPYAGPDLSRAMPSTPLSNFPTIPGAYAPMASNFAPTQAIASNGTAASPAPGDRLSFSAGPAQAAQYRGTPDGSQYGVGNYVTAAAPPAAAMPGGADATSPAGAGGASAAILSALMAAQKPAGTAAPGSALAFADQPSATAAPAQAASPSTQAMSVANPNVAGDYPSLPDSLFQSRSTDPNFSPPSPAQAAPLSNFPTIPGAYNPMAASGFAGSSGSIMPSINDMSFASTMPKPAINASSMQIGAMQAQPSVTDPTGMSVPSTGWAYSGPASLAALNQSASNFGEQLAPSAAPAPAFAGTLSAPTSPTAAGPAPAAAAPTAVPVAAPAPTIAAPQPAAPAIQAPAPVAPPTIAAPAPAMTPAQLSGVMSARSPARAGAGYQPAGRGSTANKAAQQLAELLRRTHSRSA